MALNKGLMTSNSDEWTTPRWLFDRLNERFQFTLDAAATDENHLCPNWYTKERDGLSQSWGYQRTFVNPPYSQIDKWAEKIACEARMGDALLVVALIPARTDTKWWQQHVATADHVHFIRGRLRFGDSKNSAPFPSAIAFWFGLERICRRPTCP